VPRPPQEPEADSISFVPSPCLKLRSDDCSRSGDNANQGITAAMLQALAEACIQLLSWPA